jgi:hypothetical protein
MTTVEDKDNCKPIADFIQKIMDIGNFQPLILLTKVDEVISDMSRDLKVENPPI